MSEMGNSGQRLIEINAAMTASHIIHVFNEGALP